MPINTTHPDYSKFSPAWLRNRTAYAGQRAIKAAGEEFLPRLPGHKKTPQGNEAYEAYKAQAHWLGMTKRTVEGLKGAACWKSPKIEMPNVLDGLVRREDLRFSVQDLLISGRNSILVEIGQDKEFRLCLYSAERVINWIGGPGAWETVVVDVSRFERDPEDPYAQTLVTRYLELSLADGKYQQQLWRESEKEQDGFEPEGKPIIPQQRGKPLDFIPFVLYGHTGQGGTPEEPPISEVVDCNVSHYQTDALHKQVLTKGALVQPYATGWNGKDGNGNDVTDMAFGGGALWNFPNPETRVGLLEPSGSSFEAYERDKSAIKENAAAMGARLLENQRKAAETAETTRLRTSAEQSVLAAIVDAVEEAFTSAAQMAARWAGVSEDKCLVEMSRDFLNTVATPDEMRSWMQQVQAGLMSYERYAWLCNQGEVWIPERTTEEELEAIAQDQTRLANSATLSGTTPSLGSTRQAF